MITPAGTSTIGCSKRMKDTLTELVSDTQTPKQSETQEMSETPSEPVSEKTT